MPMHDWTEVSAGIYHAFHLRWIAAISDALNSDILPAAYYALPEQIMGKAVPDVLTLKASAPNGGHDVDAELGPRDSGGGTTTLRARPQTRFHAEVESDIYRKKKNSIAIRHSSDDDLVAIVELISPGNKDSRKRFDDLINKVCQFLDERIHMLILDPFPPGAGDPSGIHDAIWRAHCDRGFDPPPDKPLTLVAYECELAMTHAYIEPLAPGDPLPDMPIFLQPEACVMVPLEATYRAAFDVQPRRWRDVLEPPPGRSATPGR
jgi:hypothetical protein